MIKINDVYSIIKGCENPLSSDVAIIDRNDFVYLFEVGSAKEIAEEINAIRKDKVVVVSHFHPDHLGNIANINYQKLYIGENTHNYTKTGEIVFDDLYLDDIHLFKINSCHAKGSIGFEIGEYAFLGDATAPTYKKGNYVFNVQMLKEEITQLEKLKANYFVFSHRMEKPQAKEEVLYNLKQIYKKREKKNSFIIV